MMATIFELKDIRSKDVLTAERIFCPSERIWLNSNCS